MANYCTANDILSLLGFKEFTTSTNPTLIQVNEIIVDVTNEIDFTLASIGILAQPTDTKVLSKLKIICKYGVAGMIGFSRFTNNTGVDGTQPNKYLEKYYEYLKDIEDNSEVYGAITGDANIYMSNPITDGSVTTTDFNNSFTKRNYDY